MRNNSILKTFLLSIIIKKRGNIKIYSTSTCHSQIFDRTEIIFTSYDEKYSHIYIFSYIQSTPRFDIKALCNNRNGIFLNI